VVAGFDAKRVRPDQCQSAGFLDHLDDVLEPFVGLALADKIAYLPDDLPSPQHLTDQSSRKRISAFACSAISDLNF
jgi:hypothetical protein